ncbi:MAG: hypothetical protein ABI776_18050, partial [Nocardioidaceae bacterium]
MASSSSDLASSLLQAGLLTGVVLVAQVFVLRNLPIESVPGVLRGRVELCNRLRPWLIAAAAAMTAAGLLLQ